jgi:acyl-CoA thioester hydrolase
MAADAPPFRYYLRVRYHECDAQKVVFNARYGEYVDLAVAEFFRAMGYGEALANGNLDYQLVKQTTVWKAPARYDQVLEISVRTVHIGTTSFTIAADFRLAGAPDVVCAVETVYVLVDAVALRKRALPESLRRALESGAAGVATDHAGYL